MKILNFGSLNIDHVYHVDHFVRPGETISTEKLEHFCGGKGLNQSIALARAGTSVWHAGKIGKDGTILKKILEDNKVNTEFISVTEGTNGHAIIQVNPSGQNSIITYGGANYEITEDFVDYVLKYFGEGDIVLLQNEISKVDYIARRCAEKKIKIVLKPSPINNMLLKTFPFELVSLFFINEIEGRELAKTEDVEKMLDTLIKIYPHSAFVLTLGHHGAIFKSSEKTYTHGIYNVDVKDTTAAGDTFTGYFLACLAAGEAIPDCLRKASVASSIAVTMRGAAPSIPTMEKVNEQEKSLHLIDFHAPILK